MKLTQGRVAKLRELLADIVRLDDEQVPDDRAPSLEEMARRAKELLPWLAPRPRLMQQLPVGTRDTKPERKVLRLLSLTEVIAEVDKRAAGRCEVPGCPHPAAIVDHWLGGSGRRTQRESVETLWKLCLEHNALRTENKPSAGKWNEIHRLWAAKHGYEHLDHATRLEVAR